MHEIKVSIRLATWRDAAEFLRLEALCFGMRVNRDTLYYWTPVVEYLWSYKAEVDGLVIGGIIAMQTRSGDWYVNSLFVHPRYRRHGVATRLLSRVIQLAGERKVLLDVKTDKRLLLRFYGSFGFEIKERRRNYYGDGTDRYLLVRR